MWVSLSSSASGGQTRNVPVDPNCTINYLTARRQPANRRLDGQVGARFACEHKQAADISPTPLCPPEWDGTLNSNVPIKQRSSVSVH